MSRSRRSLWRPVEGVPLARVTIAAQAMLAVILCAWLFTSSGTRLPFVDTPYVVHATVPDASGLDGRDHPEVTVGGVKAGFVTAVAYDRRSGGAQVTMELDKEIRGKLFADAAAHLNPRSVLQDLVVDVDPGDPSAGKLRGDRITHAGPTPLGYDRALGVLDADTRAYTQVLFATLRQIVRHRSGPLRDAIDRVPTAVDAATVVSRRLAARRRELAELVGSLDRIASATSHRGGALTRAIRSARQTLAITESRQQQIQQAIAQLPGTLTQTGATFSALKALGRPLVPALTRLRPAAQALPSGLRELRKTLPAADATVGNLDRLVRDGRAPLADLRRATQELGPASRELPPAVTLLNALVRNIAEHQDAAGAILKNWPGALSSATGLSVITRVVFLRVLPVNPGAVGLPQSSPSQTAALGQATATLRRRRPDLFKAPRGSADSPLPVVAIRALVTDLCNKHNTAACSVLSMIYDRPPGMLRP
jgi:phospholipid/cholesterol/gamma-HCH transport system substrate-binding protein